MIGLLSIDPGLRDHMGWAYWWGLPKDLELIAVGVDHPAVAYRIDKVVTELPQVYPGFRNNDPNDLIDISIDAGLRIGRIALLGVPVRMVKPRGWKGTVDKDVFTRRIVKTFTHVYSGPEHMKSMRAYTEGMKAIPANLRHNAIDAVGLGLWEQGHLR